MSEKVGCRGRRCSRQVSTFVQVRIPHAWNWRSRPLSDVCSRGHRQQGDQHPYLEVFCTDSVSKFSRNLPPAFSVRLFGISNSNTFRFNASNLSLGHPGDCRTCFQASPGLGRLMAFDFTNFASRESNT